MQFYVETRDGPGRIGVLQLQQHRVATPVIFYPHTSRFQVPDFAEIIITQNTNNHTKSSITIEADSFQSNKKTSKNTHLNTYLFYPMDAPVSMHQYAIKQTTKKNPCYLVPADEQVISEATKNTTAIIYIVANAAQLLQHQSKFVSYLTKLREAIGYQTLLYLPNVATPMNLALLVYIGIDAVDTTGLLQAARNQLLLFPTGAYPKKTLKTSPCHCPICIKRHPEEMTFDDILQHNYHTLETELKLIKHTIQTGGLRELVESRIRQDPLLTAILRILDQHHYSYLEERAPLNRHQQLVATTKESLFRPEIQRFQQRLLQRYLKPPSTKILLLLPCSAKKPYSFSKSHQLFRQVLTHCPNPHVVHEIIVTSPLGLVPRELELVYPASRYDIPVIGIWDEDEKQMIRELFHNYLQKNTYDHIILHLPLELQEIINNQIANPHCTCIDKPTTPDSLEQLSQTLTQLTKAYPKINRSKRQRENMEALASFQFSPQHAQHLLHQCTITGRYPYLKIKQENQQLAMITKERGLLSLTLNGAKRLQKMKYYQVRLSNDFTIKGSIFAPGIQHADPAIRIGDEVLTFQNQTLCGVGVALMNGTEMTQSTRGEAIKIRHHT
jgi:archaeosine synthase